MSEPKRILTNYREVDAAIKYWRKLGKTICLTQGSFDMIHIGHGRYLNKGKSLADILIVGIDSDEKIKFRKGEDRPVVPEDERLEMLSYLRPVDHAVLKKLKAPKWDLIKRIKPDVLLATDTTYTPAQITDLREWCGEIVVLRPQATTSTSAKLRRLQIGFAHNFSSVLGERIATAIEKTVAELQR